VNPLGAIDVLVFLLKNKDKKEGFTIKDICQALKNNGDKGNTYENVRKALILLESKGIVNGHCKGHYDNWRRYFKVNEVIH